jgi:ubiquinone biosynthesis protein UbiJ
MPSLPFVLALKGLETLINQALRFDPATRARLAALDGKCIYVETLSPRLTFAVQIHTRRLRLMADMVQHPHATVEAQSFELIRQAFKRDPELVGSSIKVHGNTQLVQELHAIVRELDIDWEEPLARVFGDVTASQLGRQVRGLFGFAQKAAKTFFLNTSEYLQEEKNVLPVRWELDDFLNESQDLRADGERVEARLARLEKRIKTLQSGTAERNH